MIGACSQAQRFWSWLQSLEIWVDSKLLWSKLHVNNFHNIGISASHVSDIAQVLFFHDKYCKKVSWIHFDHIHNKGWNSWRANSRYFEYWLHAWCLFHYKTYASHRIGIWSNAHISIALEYVWSQASGRTNGKVDHMSHRTWANPHL